MSPRALSLRGLDHAYGVGEIILGSALSGGGRFLLATDAGLFVVLVLAGLGENAGLLRGFLKTTQCGLDGLAWCNAYFHYSTLPSRGVRSARQRYPRLGEDPNENVTTEGP